MPSFGSSLQGKENAELFGETDACLGVTIKRTSRLQKLLTAHILSHTTILQCNNDRTLKESNRERSCLMTVRTHVENLLNKLLEIRRLGACDLIMKDACLKNLDEYRRALLEAGQSALLEMEVNTPAHDAVAQVIGFIDGSILPPTSPSSPPGGKRLTLEPAWKAGSHSPRVTLSNFPRSMSVDRMPLASSTSVPNHCFPPSMGGTTVPQGSHDQAPPPLAATMSDLYADIPSSSSSRAASTRCDVNSARGAPAERHDNAAPDAPRRALHNFPRLGGIIVSGGVLLACIIQFACSLRKREPALYFPQVMEATKTKRVKLRT